MFTHDQTRFIIALTCVTQKELKELDWWFSDMLVKMGYPEELIQRALNSIGDLSFDTACSRSVQGALRLMIGDMEAYTWNGTHIMDLGPHYLSVSLCDRPCNVKGLAS